MQQKSIIFFDGTCNLCNGAVNFIIQHDPDNKFLFASLQSHTGQLLLQQFKLPTQNFNSVILLQDEKIYTKSTAALTVASQLKGLWKSLYIFMIVPKFIRNAVYDLIAKNRYKWFGKTDACMIPTPQLKAKFLA